MSRQQFKPIPRLEDRRPCPWKRLHLSTSTQNSTFHDSDHDVVHVSFQRDLVVGLQNVMDVNDGLVFIAEMYAFHHSVRIKCRTIIYSIGGAERHSKLVCADSGPMAPRTPRRRSNVVSCLSKRPAAENIGCSRPSISIHSPACKSTKLRLWSRF